MLLFSLMCFLLRVSILFLSCTNEKYTTVTFAFVVIGAHSEVQGQFELTIANGINAEDMQTVTYYIKIEIQNIKYLEYNYAIIKYKYLYFCDFIL